MSAKATFEFDGYTMPLVQAFSIVKVMEKEGVDNCHWHFNECGCCVSVHGSDCAYVIGPDGDATFYPERGCDCDG